ncbi:EI24 domain-containing protein [Microbacterium sp. bgisy203]|uniref:EI24 domain-containing protein n=1 Tax=Microbacterium sp. bgisy203 TaxID=3413799 RepID=UPI003D745DEA
MKEPTGGFGAGVATLVHGFGYWRRRPRTMSLGLIPAAIASVLLFAALVALGVSLPALADLVTPFADGWPSLWAGILRVAVGTAMLGAAIVLAAVSFTALTLVIGDPFYERIWRAVEGDLGTPDIEDTTGFWRAARDGLALFLRGIVCAIIAALCGLVPVVGGLIGFVVAVGMSGWLLADELTTRGLAARGILAPERRALRRRHRARVLGFGVATQLCFLVPLGAVVTMPAAVAGATALARELLAGAPTAVSEPAASADRR